jgi:HicA toxin of bacterial toxin-antitoxin,
VTDTATILILSVYYISDAWACREVNKSQKRTLERIFADPVRANIDWHDVESLLVALGAELEEGRGSRMRVELNDVVAVFHKPHPQKEASKPAVRDVRSFLIAAGIQPPD